MPSTLREAVRKRLTVRSVASVVAALAILRVALDASVAQLAVTAALSFVAGTADIAREVYDVRESVASGGSAPSPSSGAVPCSASTRG